MYSVSTELVVPCPQGLFSPENNIVARWTYWYNKRRAQVAQHLNKKKHCIAQRFFTHIYNPSMPSETLIFETPVFYTILKRHFLRAYCCYTLFGNLFWVTCFAHIVFTGSLRAAWDLVHSQRHSSSSPSARGSCVDKFALQLL